MRIASVATVFPDHYYTTEQLFSFLKSSWKEHPEIGRFDAMARRSGVLGRHLSRPLESYGDLVDFGARNAIYLEVARGLSQRAARLALDQAEVSPSTIRALVSTTVTGVATPSLDAGLVNDLGLPPDVKRMPIFGLGCVGGAAGLARAFDYLRAYPSERVLLSSVELCSLTFQRSDSSMANLIATSLFADGAVCLALEGGDLGGSGPEVVATRSVFYPDTEETMGWEVGSSGFKIRLSPAVPALVLEHLRADVDSFLAGHGLSRQDLASYVMHPGGPKVLESIATALELPRDSLSVSWECLARVGNLSSASVLMILGETISQKPPRPGSWGLLAAMGPGFCTELVLLRW